MFRSQCSCTIRSLRCQNELIHVAVRNIIDEKYLELRISTTEKINSLQFLQIIKKLVTFMNTVCQT